MGCSLTAMLNRGQETGAGKDGDREDDVTTDLSGHAKSPSVEKWPGGRQSRHALTHNQCKRPRSDQRNRIPAAHTCSRSRRSPASRRSAHNAAAAAVLSVECHISCRRMSMCFGGQVLCDGVCREVAMDPANCGSCGHVCGPGETPEHHVPPPGHGAHAPSRQVSPASQALPQPPQLAISLAVKVQVPLQSVWPGAQAQFGSAGLSVPL